MAKIHNLEQAEEDVFRYYIPMLRKFYIGCIEEGFSEEQSIELLKKHMDNINQIKK